MMTDPEPRASTGQFTNDGFEVYPAMRLRFQCPYMGWIGGFSIGFSAIEFNNDNGRKRPYVQIYAGLWYFQIGWLWK